MPPPHDDGWDRWCDEKWEEHQETFSDRLAEIAHLRGECDPEECSFCLEEAA